MRLPLLISLVLLGCGSSTSAQPGGTPLNDGGVDSTGTTEKPCFGDGWCVEHTGRGLPSDVWASGADDVWVIEQDRTLHHFDGKSWTTSTVPAEGQGQSIFGRAKNDLWVAVGQGMVHYDGTSWTPEVVTPPTGLLRYAIDNSGKVWARSGAGGVYVREGTTWTAKLRDKTVEIGGAGIASCDGNLWLATGLMAEWDGTSFWQHGVNDGDQQIYGAGTYGAGNAWVSSAFLRRPRDGKFQANLTEGAPRAISAMNVGSDGKAWALADGPVLASFDGISWKKHPTADLKDVIDVGYVSPTVARLMVKNGAMRDWDSVTSTSTPIVGAAGFTVVGAFASTSWRGPDEVYYNEGGRVWSWKPGSTDWTSVASTHSSVRRIWAASSTVGWGVGGRDAKSWGTTASPSSTLLEGDETYLDVGGSGPNDVWLITTKRNIHYNGATWTPYPSGFPAANSPARVVSFGPSDVWVFRSYGNVAHFDGTAFKAERQQPVIDWIGCAGAGELLAVSQNPTDILRGPPLALAKVSDTYPEHYVVDVAFGAGNAWILGGDVSKNQLAFYDGAKLTRSVDGTNRSFSAVFALPSGEAWAVGSGGVMHKKP